MLYKTEVEHPKGEKLIIRKEELSIFHKSCELQKKSKIHIFSHIQIQVNTGIMVKL